MKPANKYFDSVKTTLISMHVFRPDREYRTIAAHILSYIRHDYPFKAIRDLLKDEHQIDSRNDSVKMSDLLNDMKSRKKEGDQKQRLLKHFKSGGSITSYEAYLDFDITQLATRLSELEELLGVRFKRVWIRHNNKRFVRYSYNVKPKENIWAFIANTNEMFSVSKMGTVKDNRSKPPTLVRQHKVKGFHQCKIKFVDRSRNIKIKTLVSEAFPKTNEND